ncbi:MAG: hypothetical protein CSB34_04525 [Desulfobulbus propionicus]|nr:MAG: hypothetical protein CSB34_04525 [Desulfobulbus propionicus]
MCCSDNVKKSGQQKALQMALIKVAIVVPKNPNEVKNDMTEFQRPNQEEFNKFNDYERFRI